VALITLTPGIDGFPTSVDAVPDAARSTPAAAPVSPPVASRAAVASADGSPAVPSAPAARRPVSPARRVLGALLNGAGTLLVIAAIMAFLFLAVGPRFLGYQTATMLTGSMAPSIVPGDVVVTTEQPVAAVEVGDVISYHIPVEDHRVETHRVVEVITNPDGTTAVRTKGDANEAADPWVATLDGDHVYQQAFVIPVIGEAIRALRTPIVSDALVYGAPAVLVIGLLTMIWSRPAPTTDDNTGAPEALETAGTGH
jgi:signal peptidase